MGVKHYFDKFLEALKGTIDHVKTELMPEVDFSKFEENAEKTEGATEGAAGDTELTWE